MDKKIKKKIVLDFLKDVNNNGKSDITCPDCNTKLKYHEHDSGYTVSCGTENCLSVSFRGI